MASDIGGLQAVAVAGNPRDAGAFGEVDVAGARVDEGVPVALGAPLKGLPVVLDLAGHVGARVLERLGVAAAHGQLLADDRAVGEVVDAVLRHDLRTGLAYRQKGQCQTHDEAGCGLRSLRHSPTSSNIKPPESHPDGPSRPGDAAPPRAVSPTPPHGRGERDATVTVYERAPTSLSRCSLPLFRSRERCLGSHSSAPRNAERSFGPGAYTAVPVGIGTSTGRAVNRRLGSFGLLCGLALSTPATAAPPLATLRPNLVLITP